MTRAGRAIQVQHVLTTTVIYHAMALDLPKWAIKAIDKIRRGFLWKGRKDVLGGHCLVAWGKVTRPKELGGLGISDLQKLNWALWVRWLWLEKTDPSKSWVDLPLQSSSILKSILSTALITKVGDGRNTLFWRDRWLMGLRIEDLTPHIFALVPTRIANRRTVAEGIVEMAWIRDLKGTITWVVLSDFLTLSEVIADFSLSVGVPDKHIWKFSPTGQYSSKSAYDMLFIGSTSFGAFERVWESWAPSKCSFFIWLVMHNRCWTADRLARRGLPHPSVCPLCDQEEETIQHLLISCVFARQFWYFLLSRSGLPNLSPDNVICSLDDWWSRAVEKIPRDLQSGFNSLVILGAWSLWRHRNDCVFNGRSPSLASALTLAGDELRMWCSAGAKGLNLLSTLVFMLDPGG
jgi:hypothetical protein